VYHCISSVQPTSRHSKAAGSPLSRCCISQQSRNRYVTHPYTTSSDRYPDSPIGPSPSRSPFTQTYTLMMRWMHAKSRIACSTESLCANASSP
jgi:hypothetical protein